MGIKMLKKRGERLEATGLLPQALRMQGDPQSFNLKRIYAAF